jgi:uncharacterized protein YajQ (UPF0234 family)
MPSFDIVNQIDLQEVDNAVNITKKTVANRYDFRGIETEITLNKKEKSLNLVTGDDMKMRALEEMLNTNLVRRSISAKAFDYGEVEPTSKGAVKRTVKIRDGIDMDTARDIVKRIKGMKIKVQAQIQDQQVRVTGKKIDDLQSVIAMLKEADLPVPLQYVNMKS